MGSRLVRVRVRQRDQKLATKLMRVLVAAIHQDHDTELLSRDEPNIGRRIVETAGLVHDDGPIVVLDLPRHSLRVMRINLENGMLRELHSPPQPRLDRMRGNGMAATVGRLRECNLLD